MMQAAAMVLTLAAAQFCAALCIAAGLFVWRALR